MLEYYRYQQKEEEIQTRIHDAHKSGLKKGKEEGIAEGEKNAKIEAAKKMLQDGLSIELVTKYSGLSIQELSEMKKLY